MLFETVLQAHVPDLHSLVVFSSLIQNFIFVFLPLKDTTLIHVCYSVPRQILESLNLILGNWEYDKQTVVQTAGSSASPRATALLRLRQTLPLMFKEELNWPLWLLSKMWTSQEPDILRRHGTCDPGEMPVGMDKQELEGSWCMEGEASRTGLCLCKGSSATWHIGPGKFISKDLQLCQVPARSSWHNT